MNWNIGTLDLDWEAEDQERAGPRNGREILAEEMAKGAEVLAVWWEPLNGDQTCGFARVLYRTPADSDEIARQVRAEFAADASYAESEFLASLKVA